MKDIGQPAISMGPEDCVQYLKKGSDQYGRVIKEFKIKLEW